jgi:hypothetical protein
LTNEEALIDRAIAVVADTIDLAMGCKERILLVNLFLRFVHSALLVLVLVHMMMMTMMMMMFFCFSFLCFCFY